MGRGVEALVLGFGCRSWHDALRAASQRPIDQHIERAFAGGQHAPQHGHVHTCDQPHLGAVGHTLGAVARCRTEHVGQDQHLCLTRGSHGLAHGLFNPFGRPIGRNIHGSESVGAIRHHMGAHRLQGGGQRGMGDDHQGSHARIIGDQRPA